VTVAYRARRLTPGAGGLNRLRPSVVAEQRLRQMLDSRRRRRHAQSAGKPPAALPPALSQCFSRASHGCGAPAVPRMSAVMSALNGCAMNQSGALRDYEGKIDVVSVGIVNLLAAAKADRHRQ